MWKDTIYTFLSLVTGTVFLPGWSRYTQVGLPTSTEFWRMESTRSSTPGTDPRLPSGTTSAPRWGGERWQQWPRVCQKTETLGLSSRWQHQMRGLIKWAMEASKPGANLNFANTLLKKQRNIIKEMKKIRIQTCWGEGKFKMNCTQGFYTSGKNLTSKNWPPLALMLTVVILR
jgi:hypothetical protein